MFPSYKKGISDRFCLSFMENRGVLLPQLRDDAELCGVRRAADGAELHEALVCCNQIQVPQGMYGLAPSRPGEKPYFIEINSKASSRPNRLSQRWL